MFDPDDNLDDEPLPQELQDLDRLLSKLQDCDLDEWSQDFVDDMVKRLTKFKHRLTVTPRQWEQLERLEKQHL